MSYYYQFTLNPMTGFPVNWVFLTKDAAERCLESYRARANKQAKETGGKATHYSGSTQFEWNSPVGFIYWSANVRELASEDGRFQ